MNEVTLEFKMQRHGREGWFFATVPDVDGLMSFGPTLEVTIERLLAAAALLVDARANEAKSKAIKVKPRQWHDVEVNSGLVAA